MIIKEYRVEVVSFNYWNAWILIFASIIIIVAVVIFYYCMKKIRIKMYFRKLKEQYKDV
jgi:heme/copper-type cytochrome/quinol oxidase subunit 4